jgi:hypothetical protein
VGASVGRHDAGVREFFFDFIAREYPALLDGYQRLYAGARATASYVDAVHASIERAKTATAGR